MVGEWTSKMRRAHTSKSNVLVSSTGSDVGQSGMDDFYIILYMGFKEFSHQNKLINNIFAITYSNIKIAC